MKVLGPRASLAKFRKDLVYLQARLEADKNPAIQALAPSAASMVGELYAERDAFETIENLRVIATARRKGADEEVDEDILQLGAESRTKDKDLYGRLFPALSPSKTANMPQDQQVLENKRILGELKVEEAGHPIRVEYEADLEAAMVDLDGRMAQEGQSKLNLTLARTHLKAWKAKADKFRLEAEAKLVLILGSKQAASKYFRPDSDAREDDEVEEGAPKGTEGEGSDK